MSPGQQHRGASAAERNIRGNGHDQAESGPGGAGEDEGRDLAEHPERGRRAEPFGVGAHSPTVVGYMEDMTGRWAWRGNRSSEADDAAAGNRVDTVRGDIAEEGGAANGAAGDRETSAQPQPPRGPREPLVPVFLQRAAAWSWRLIVVGLLVYVAFRVASALRLVVLPCFAALLLTALLQPLTARLRRAGMPSLAATWCTVLAAVAVLAGIGVLAANRVSADYPRLQGEVRHTAHQVQASLAGPPFHLSSARLNDYYNQIAHFLSQHQSLIAGTVVTGGENFPGKLTSPDPMMLITVFLAKGGRPDLTRQLTAGD